MSLANTAVGTGAIVIRSCPPFKLYVHCKPCDVACEFLHVAGEVSGTANTVRCISCKLVVVSVLVTLCVLLEHTCSKRSLLTCSTAGIMYMSKDIAPLYC